MIKDTLSVRLDPSDAEFLPLGRLLSLAERRLLEGNVLDRASRSKLYDRRWRRLGVRPERVRNLTQLQAIPYTDGNNWLIAQGSGSIARFVAERARLWASSRCKTRKWVPFGEADLRRMMGLALRLSAMIGLGPHERILAITEPAPRIGNCIPYFWVMADMVAGDLHLEMIPGSVTMLGRNNWPEFAAGRHPQVLWGHIDDVQALADALCAAGKDPATLYPDLRLLLCFGAPLEPKRADLHRLFGTNPLSCYLSAELPYLQAECTPGGGIHLWLDVTIPEIIPTSELSKEKEVPRYVPRALFIADAPDGTVGEYVVTTFGQSLPLIRYRSGDQVQLVSKGTCACGRTHPRVQFLGRITAGSGA